MALLSLSLTSCLERAQPELRIDPELASQAQSWDLASSFGGVAVPANSSSDPWEQRFEPGGFVDIAGVCATGGEVWVCDLGVSRIQVFSPDGSFKREYGQGVPLEQLLPSNRRLYEDNGKRKGDPGHWDTQFGAPWAGTEGRLFRVADLDIRDGHLWTADWARTGLESRFTRESGVRRFVLPDPFLGSQEDLGTPVFKDNTKFAWPRHISVGRESIAISEPWGNCVRLYRPLNRDPWWGQTDISVQLNIARLIDAREGARGHAQYEEYLAMNSSAGGGPAQFNEVRGVCVAFDKILTCDVQNARIQVFDGHTQDRFYWGKLLRVFQATDPGGYPRFKRPMDLDISPEGDIYVLDIDRLEVAVLNSRFQRIGSFGRGLISMPRAIDLSDDGRECFVTDGAGGKVLRFVRSDAGSSRAAAESAAPGA
ncbi:hypothetical protein IT575_12425 [bacterium]|nr:hypothetical protein [bacterium]